MKHILLCIIAASLVVGSGCANITVLRVAEIKAVSARVDSLRADLATLNEKLLNEQRSSNEMLRLIRADQQVHFGELDRAVAAIGDNIAESQTRLSRIDEKTQVITRKVEERISADSLKAAATESEMENIFNLSMQDFSAGRYDIAYSGFIDLMTRFPQSAHAEEATYWKAECRYLKAEYDSAEVAYKDYVKAYPTGRKISTTLFKLGMVYEKAKKKKSADAVWGKLIEQYPESEEAQMAKQKLGIK